MFSTSRFHSIPRIPNMRKAIPFALLLLLAAAPLLGACHTAAGVGEDMSSAGHAVTNDAVKSTP
jgi:predicted small secreted protein